MDRLEKLSKEISKNEVSTTTKNTLTVKDSRTGKVYQLPITRDYINANDLLQIKDTQGRITRSYDPGYMNTISCTSRISYIDGDQGILQYRGYPIEQLAEKSNFLEVAFLLVNGELPTKDQFNVFKQRVMSHTFLNNDVCDIMKTFRYDAHPMGMIISTLSTLSTFHPQANPALAKDPYDNVQIRNKQIYRMLGNMPSIAANSFRHRIGKPFNNPAPGLDYVQNFLYMLDALNDHKFRPHPQLVRALDILFILHAEHELNCSTAAVRHLESSGVDVYSTIAGATAALYGPKHGGANEAVLRMLEKIGSKDQIPQFIQDVKDKKSLLFGFGHRIYKSYDPRAQIVKRVSEQVFDIVGKEPLVEIAMELEKIALTDQYFIKRQLYPNVDFYSGVIYKAMGFPTDMFAVLFTIPRVAGWLAHWAEFLHDKENKIVRPRQHYTGYANRNYVPINQRKQNKSYTDIDVTATYKRRQVSIEHSKKK